MSRLLLRHLDLIDVRAGQLLPDREILIDGREIVAVSDERISADGATVLDLGGRIVLPGLVDCHVHINVAAMGPPILPSLGAALASVELREMLLRGFTTARDVAGADAGFRVAVERGIFLGPRLFVSGDALTQTGGHGDSRGPAENQDQQRVGSVIVDGADAVRKAVRENLRRGVDHIKLMVSGGISSPSDPLEGVQFTEAEIRAATETAASAGKYVAAHAYTDEAVYRAVDCGVRTIEHGSLISDRAAKKMAEAGAILVPTLSPYYWVATKGEELGLPSYHIEKAKIPYEATGKAIEIARRHGVTVAYGTDLYKTPHEQQAYEFILRAEVETPAETLRSATVVGAEVVGLQGKVGEIVRGAFADLLAVDGNPLEDLSLLQDQGAHIPLIVSDGRIVKNELP